MDVPQWKVEIASPPGVTQAGFLTEELTAIGAAVEHAVDELELLDGSGSGSGDGRVGGEWTIYATSAAQAAVGASEILVRALLAAGVPFDKAVVDVLHIERLEDS